MSLKLFLLGIGITALSALVVWLAVLFTVDPGQATHFEFILFYLSLFIWLTGSICLGGFYLRLLKSNNEFYYGNLLISLRQACLASLYVTVTLALRGLRLIALPEAILLFVATLLFEMYFLAKK